LLGSRDPGRDPGKPYGTRVFKNPGINIPSGNGNRIDWNGREREC